MINVGLLGLGTVGTGVVKVLNKYDFINIKKISVKNPDKKRDVKIADGVLTTNSENIVSDNEINIVIEVIGGIEPALSLIKQAIKNKKHVVTANKELLAKHGEELFELAKENNVLILFEAAVAGGIPIIMPLKQSLAGNTITKVAGILNGTTNYILTRMENEGCEYQEVLEDAQDLGYAEADPSGDVKGFDAAYKIAIIASLAFNKRISMENINIEGIDKISAVDINYAKEFGYKIKLIALAKEGDDKKLDVRVHPMLIKKDHPLANVNDVLNAVFVEGDAVGQAMFMGPGAGEMPTASSVCGDVISIASELEYTDYPLPMMRCKHEDYAKLKTIEESKNKYYIRVKASNNPGVIGELGTICGKNHINLESIIQRETSKEKNLARVVLKTELSLEKNVNKALEQIKKHNEIEQVIRIME